jgi:CheY-like chemotaxis protein
MVTPGAPGFVDADPIKLERVVAHVLKNAIQYTPAGGRIEVAARIVRNNAWAEISVTDNGIGVAPEHLARLTERYYRVGPFVSGMGLGLSFCREVLDRHGGEIEIVSPPQGLPGGTQVLIRLPLSSPPLVMAVDDSITIRKLLERQLRLQGYAVSMCSDAEEALAAIVTKVPDLLVVDSVMPGKDGVELISIVKNGHALRHVPIVMITGAEVDRPKREILEELRVPVLGKPWTEEELTTCLEDAIYGKHYLER